MQPADHETLITLRDWLTQGHTAALATVVRTYGSSPRPPGALVAIRDDGAVAGSVSGGCIEQDLIARVHHGLPSQPELLTFGGTPDENRRIGLPCGGKLEIMWEPAPPHALLDELLVALAQRTPIARRLDRATGESTLLAPRRDAQTHCDAYELLTVYSPQWRMLIIGAVQTAHYLAEMAQALDYQVLICEPREEYRMTWTRPTAPFIDAMPDDAVHAISADAHTAVIALTHDAKLDDLALMEALRTSAFYVGALGSQRNQAKRRERLALFDLKADDIARLRGPVGLPIGSHTPAEIAVAILADLIAVRNNIELVRADAPTCA